MVRRQKRDRVIKRCLDNGEKEGEGRDRRGSFG